MDLGTQAVILISMLTLAGTFLGGAVAHWQRGSGYIITGAIIGAAAMLVVGVLGAIYSLGGVVVMLGMIALAIFWLIFG